MHMHATPIISKCQYHCRNGQMVSTLTKAVFPMIDCHVEDGSFAAIPGAHKSNFPRPWGEHPDENPVLTPIPANAGDAIIFTEALNTRLSDEHFWPPTANCFILLQHRLHA